MPCCGQKQPNRNLLRIAQEAAGAAGRVAMAVVHGKTVFTTEELQKERIKICGTGKCGWFRYRTNFCGHCKCFLPAKTSLTTESCPLGHW